MKNLVIICNGLTDEPIAEKDNRTPLQLSEIPQLDRIAAEGRCGSVRTIPEGAPSGAEVSFPALLGYEPESLRAGAAQWVARALDLEIGEGEIPLCCDFISLQSSHNDMVMKDYTAGQLAGEDAKVLLKALQDQIVDEEIQFHYGNGYHNLMVIRHAPFPGRLHPPNELIGEGIRQYMPQDQESRDLVYLMNQAQIILHNHPFNKKRKQAGEDSVNSVWFWGNGPEESKPVPSFFSRFEKKAAIITPSLMMRGLAKTLEINWIPVEGATGFVDTDYRAKAAAALEALKKNDVVFLHVAGAETVSLQGNIDDKVQAIEDFDRELLDPILEAMETDKDMRLLLVESHMSSVNLMKYKNDPVPFVVYPSAQSPDHIEKFDEEIVTSGSEHLKQGPALLEAFLKGIL
jgi:2,3-bisphosphoglycerate-independent phosphoglycerate mutase